MEITAENMSTMLGNEATDADAIRFAEHLERGGWELSVGMDGQIEASRNDAMMSESEWAAELNACFN